MVNEVISLQVKPEPRDPEEIGPDGRYSLDWEEHQFLYRVLREETKPRVKLGYAHVKRKR